MSLVRLMADPISWHRLLSSCTALVSVGEELTHNRISPERPRRETKHATRDFLLSIHYSPEALLKLPKHPYKLLEDLGAWRSKSPVFHPPLRRDWLATLRTFTRALSSIFIENGCGQDGESDSC